jgi:acyl-CoA synthetase (AMP-forming)/AMP-acid ligase II
VPGGASDLPPEHPDLVPQSQELDVPRPRGSAPEEHQVGQHRDEGVEDGQEQQRLLNRGGGTLPDRGHPPATEYAYPTRGKIATYKIPRYVKFVDSFPMTVTGKVQKFKMREEAIEELGLAQAGAVATA